MLFGIVALLTVGASWCLVGIIIGRAPKDGLDTKLIQFFGSTVSILFGLMLTYVWIPAGNASQRVILLTCGTYFIAGIFNYAGIQSMSRGMQHGPNGVVWGIMQSALIFPFLGGVIWFHVALTIPRAIGILFLVTAILLFALAKNTTAHKENPRTDDSSPVKGSWRIWAFVALMMMAIQQNLGTMPSYFPEAREVSSVLRSVSAAGGTFVAAIFGLFLIPGKGRRTFSQVASEMHRARLWGYVLAMQFFSLIFAYTLLYPGLDCMAERGAGAVCYPMMVGSCIVVFTIYTRLVLKEKMLLAQKIALALCLLGLVGLCFPA